MKKLIIIFTIILNGFCSFSQNVKTSQIENKNETDSIKNDIFGYNKFIGKKIFINKDDYSRDSVKTILGFTYSIGHDLLTEDRVVYPVLTGRHANIVSYRDSLTNKTFTCIGVVETKDIVKKTYLKLNNQITGIIYLDILTASNDITTSDEISKNKSDSIRQVKENELSKIEAAKKEIEQEKEIENPFSQIDYYYDEFNYTKKYNTSIQLPEKIADTSYYKTLMRFFTKKLQKV